MKRKAQRTLAACAVAGALVLAGCSKSGSSGQSVGGTTGAFGSVPAASAFGHTEIENLLMEPRGQPLQTPQPLQAGRPS